LQELAREHALQVAGQEMEVTLRETRVSIETALAGAAGLVHLSSGDAIEAGAWGLTTWPGTETLADRAEILTVNFLQKNPECHLPDVEQEVFGGLPGLFTPSRQTILAILDSYAQEADGLWQLRDEDRAARRRDDLTSITRIIEQTGQRLNYRTRREGTWLAWEENDQVMHAFCVLVSAIVGPALTANPFPAGNSVLVIPGGRVGLIGYKLALRIDLAVRMKEQSLTRFRLWRSLADVKILTRESFAEQMASDRAESTPGQMMMF
jgi:hypothetical protein